MTRVILCVIVCVMLSCATKTTVLYKNHPMLDKEDPFSMNCMVCDKDATRAFHGGLVYKVIEDQLVTLCAVLNHFVD